MSDKQDGRVRPGLRRRCAAWRSRPYEAASPYTGTTKTQSARAHAPNNRSFCCATVLPPRKPEIPSRGDISILDRRAFSTNVATEPALGHVGFTTWTPLHKSVRPDLGMAHLATLSPH